MSFADMLLKDAVIYDLESTSREDVIKEILTKMQEHGALKEGTFNEVLEKLMAREAIGSTGIGGGKAVPHTKHVSIDRPVMAIARSSKGVNFGALDGEPVYLFFMLLSPDTPDNALVHLRALTFISTALDDDFFCKFLKNSNSRDDMLEIIQEMDEKS